MNSLHLLTYLLNEAQAFLRS